MAKARPLPADHKPFEGLPVTHVTVGSADERIAIHLSGRLSPNRMPVVDRIALKKAIAQLPNGYKNVFVLHDVEGFEHEEVARMLRISVGTSKSQLHKARLKLRGLLIKTNE